MPRRKKRAVRLEAADPRHFVFTVSRLMLEQKFKRDYGLTNPFGELGMGLNQMILEKRPEIFKIAARHGAYNLRLFGSVARGEADEASDVDILVELEPDRSLLDLGGFLSDLEDLLQCKVDVVTERGLKNRIRERVLQEAVPL